MGTGDMGEDSGAAGVPPVVSPAPRAKLSAMAVVVFVLCLIPITIPIGVILGAATIVRLRRQPDHSGRGLVIAGFCAAALLCALAIGLLVMKAIEEGGCRGHERAVGKGQIASITKACAAYILVFDNQIPGPIADPPGEAAPWVSGSQNLWLSLIGCDADYNAFTPDRGGPYAIIGDTSSEKHPIFYRPKDREYRRHQEIALRDAKLDAQYRNGFVLTDMARTREPRPILYYRLREVNVRTPDVFPLHYKANAVYCTARERLAQRAKGSDGGGAYSVEVDELGTFVGPHACAYGFVLISAGCDGQYFTEDDYVNPR